MEASGHVPLLLGKRWQSCGNSIAHVRVPGWGHSPLVTPKDAFGVFMGKVLHNTALSSEKTYSLSNATSILLIKEGKGLTLDTISLTLVYLPH